MGKAAEWQYVNNTELKIRGLSFCSVHWLCGLKEEPFKLLKPQLSRFQNVELN